ncbi:hypothetical protein ACW9HQ_41035, partial [Nocardia gipuzkoensis]
SVQPYPQPGYAQQIAAQVVDAPYHDPRYSALPPNQGGPGYGLPGTAGQQSVTGRQDDPELDYRGTRELPPGRRSE